MGFNSASKGLTVNSLRWNWIQLQDLLKQRTTPSVEIAGSMNE